MHRINVIKRIRDAAFGGCEEENSINDTNRFCHITPLSSLYKTCKYATARSDAFSIRTPPYGRETALRINAVVSIVSAAECRRRFVLSRRSNKHGRPGRETRGWTRVRFITAAAAISRNGFNNNHSRGGKRATTAARPREAIQRRGRSVSISNAANTEFPVPVSDRVSATAIK